ncbi:MAG: bifunctional folylpolyglutamate synthase/dihydrofolate synthase [Candidatus Omnitrophica bacterium]|nr:bifunctional folylpolyglutamate synthase/dihydrofolate synthase [Candidatus Omnitrophota bacterium]
MTYPEVIKYLKSFINYEKIPAYRYRNSLGVNRVKGFLRSLGNPQDGIKFIHIAGTKGKGSTCVFIAYILKEAGYKTGLYTSPHLADFRERIRVLPGRDRSEFEGIIPKSSLKRLVYELKPKIDRYNRNSVFGPLTFFEVYTALAIKYFKEQKVDFAVLETGLGGRLDATNAANAVISVITPISYEHTDKLGKTLKEIATEKAGIIKGGEICVISAPQEKKAKEVIGTRCRKLNVKLCEVNKYQKFRLRLLGKHQLINAAVAKKAVETLKTHAIINLSCDVIRKGLYKALWPARCEIIKRKPYIILDGAQNAASAKALKETIRENFSAKGGSASGGKYKKLILVLGISQDKDIKGICSQVYALADKIILTRAQSLRGLDSKTLACYFKGKEIYITDSVAEAKILSMRLAKKHDLVLVTGSLFVTGEFKYGKREFN